MKKTDGGYLLQFFEKIIKFLCENTIFELIKRILQIKNFRSFADTYVIIMTILSILLITGSRNSESVLLLNIIAVIVIYRICEMTITIINNFFVSDQSTNKNQDKRVYSVKRSLLLLCINIFEIINLFIVLYIRKSKINGLYELPSYLDFFKASFFSFVTQNTDMINNICVEYNNLSFLESILGYIYTVYLLSILIGNAPRIRSLSNK